MSMVLKGWQARLGISCALLHHVLMFACVEEVVSRLALLDQTGQSASKYVQKV